MGPDRKGSRRSKGANIQTQIEEAILSLRQRNFHEHPDTAEASGTIPGEDGESGAHGGEDEDDGGLDQHMHASGSSEDLGGLGLGGAVGSPPAVFFRAALALRKRQCLLLLTFPLLPVLSENAGVTSVGFGQSVRVHNK